MTCPDQWRECLSKFECNFLCRRWSCPWIEGDPQQLLFYGKEGYYVVCTEREGPGARRVRDHSRARRHRRHRCDAAPGTQDRQHLQHHQQLVAVTRS
jgi:hypothetical protein